MGTLYLISIFMALTMTHCNGVLQFIILIDIEVNGIDILPIKTLDDRVSHASFGGVTVNIYWCCI